MRRFWRYGWVGLLLLPAMAWGGFPEHYSEVLAAMRPYHGICWETFSAPLTSERMTSDRIWANAVRRSPCGTVTLLPGERLSLADISEKDCTHRKGFHDHGPFQTVWEHTFLVRLMAMDGRLHDFAFGVRHYDGNLYSGTGYDDSRTLYFFDAAFGVQWDYTFFSSYRGYYFETKLFWDGQNLYGEVIPIYNDWGEGEFEDRSLTAPKCFGSYLERLWSAPLCSSSPAFMPWWKTFNEAALRSRCVRVASVPSNSILDRSYVTYPSPFVNTWLPNSYWRTIFPSPVDVPAGSVLLPEEERGIWRLLRADNTLAAILVSGLPWPGVATLYDSRWGAQTVFVRDGYHKPCPRYRWDGAALTFQWWWDICYPSEHAKDTVYRDFPLSVSFREVRKGEWGACFGSGEEGLASEAAGACRHPAGRPQPPPCRQRA